MCHRTFLKISIGPVCKLARPQSEPRINQSLHELKIIVCFSTDIAHTNIVDKKSSTVAKNLNDPSVGNSPKVASNINNLYVCASA